MSHRRLTPAQERDVARRYGEGESLNQLALSYGCSITPIRAALKKHNVTSHPTGPRVFPRARVRS